MDHSMKVGLSFGTTSGIITTLGMLAGLYAVTGSRTAVLSGIFIIAVADSLSDAFGIHMSEESEGVHTQREIWVSTLCTLVTKLIVASSFAVPFFFLGLAEAVAASIAWGILMITVLSCLIAKNGNMRPMPVVAEHLAISLFVVAATYLVGKWASVLF